MMEALQERWIEKVWGRQHLPHPFVARGAQPIGEICFAPPSAMPDLLVKYLFTSEKLSVQVHPDEHHAPPGATGKDECWYVLDADPDAKLAIGLEKPLSAEELKRSALDGSIESHLQWHSASKGDFFYLPAGTIHAIGPGLSLVEVQQNSEITYRLYDYGRPRELHLDQAIKVAERGPYASGLASANPGSDEKILIEGRYFRLARIEGRPSETLRKTFCRPVLLIPLTGEYRLDGSTAAAGACVYVEDAGRLDCIPGSSALIACSSA